MKLFVYELVSAGGLGDRAAVSLRREGWAMLSALVEDFVRIEGLEIHTLLSEGAPAPLGHVCRGVSSKQEPDAFRDAVERCDATLVIAPECYGLLEERTRQVRDAQKSCFSSNPEAVALCADKKSLAAHWKQFRVPTPELFTSDSHAFPLVCKPRHGAGSQGIFRVNDFNGLATCFSRAQREMPNDEILLQEHVTGIPASITFLIGPEQKLTLPPGRQLLSNDGRFRYLGGVLPLPAPLAQRALRLGEKAIAEVRGLRGFVGVDMILGGNVDWAIEINPRLTTSYLGLRRLTVQNLAELWCKVTRSETVVPPSWNSTALRFRPDRAVY